MAKASWGTKRTCPCGNGVRFYDLNKKEIECPSCGENINVEQLLESNIVNNPIKKPKYEVPKKLKTDKKKNLDSTGSDIEPNTEENSKIEVEEIIGDKLKKNKEKKSE